jgi:hypothetical protein
VLVPGHNGAFNEIVRILFRNYCKLLKIVLLVSNQTGDEYIITFKDNSVVSR